MRLRYVCLVVCTAISVQAQQGGSAPGQLTAAEAQAIEAAWASGQRLTNTPVGIARGFDRPGAAAPVQNVTTDATGIARTSTKRWERIVIHLPRPVAADHMACLMVNGTGKCLPLPVGASIDKANSILYWHVPNAYKGDFDLVFLQLGSRPGVVRVTAGTGD